MICGKLNSDIKNCWRFLFLSYICEIKHLGDWDVSAQLQNEAPLLYGELNAFSANGDIQKRQNHLFD
jgi:hypothetical protein